MRNYKVLFLVSLFSFLGITFFDYFLVFGGFTTWGYVNNLLVIGGLTIGLVVLSICTATFYDRYAEEMESLNTFAMIPLYDEMQAEKKDE